MKNVYPIKKELIYLIASLLLGYFFNFLFLGKDALSFRQTLDINIYDTYFVFQNYAILFLPILAVMFLIYLIRILKFGYGNTWVNWSFCYLSLALSSALINWFHWSKYLPR